MKVARTHWEVTGMQHHLLRFGFGYRWNILCEEVVEARCELSEYP
jgi:hypothetical protein